MNADIGTKLRSLSIERIDPPQGGPLKGQRRTWRGRTAALLLAAAALASGLAGAYWERDRLAAELARLSDVLHLNAPAKEPARTALRSDQTQAQDGAQDGAQPPAVAVLPPVVGSGYVIAERMVTLKPEIGGRILSVPVETGQTVKAGDRIALMDNRTAIIQSKIARSSLANTEVNVERIRLSLAKAEKDAARAERLKERGVVSENAWEDNALTVHQLRQDLNAARQAIETARLQVEAQERNLQLHEIVAPFDGIVAERLVRTGDILAAGTDGAPGGGIAILLDPTSLAINVDVAQSNTVRITSGQSGTAVFDAFPDAPLEVRVRAVLPVASAQKGTITVRLDFLAPPPAVLPNMSVKVTFDGRKPTGSGHTQGMRNG
ncbi:efflux RND transporter periplasmic adaptor subunit [Breoghania sp.]|uniref:efflux RND transporter periplasmic adaptor subunit n=1 Tax=Breoghania sp. TaxID=2065378 RepID=UPI0029C9F3E9|nr:efflux RND transporter periplasmic adaptor subunit [Breoghania sp.]